MQGTIKAIPALTSSHVLVRTEKQLILHPRKGTAKMRSQTRSIMPRWFAYFLILTVFPTADCATQQATGQEPRASAVSDVPPSERSGETSGELVLQNEFVRVVVSDGAVSMFCCDSTGRGQYGPNLLAAEGIRSPQSPLQVAINGRDVEIRLSDAKAAEVQWSVPFHCGLLRRRRPSPLRIRRIIRLSIIPRVVSQVRGRDRACPIHRRAETHRHAHVLFLPTGHRHGTALARSAPR